MLLFGQKVSVLHGAEKFVKADDLRAAKRKTVQRKLQPNITKEKHKDLRNNTSTEPHLSQELINSHLTVVLLICAN